MSSLGETVIGSNEFRWGERTYIMGIINLSPDSFSGDGLATVEDALSQARRFESEGADILDIGGESTRPGAAAVSIEDEIKRVVPAIERIAREVAIPVSVDTYKYEVAEKAVEAGAAMINDQWGLRYDTRMAQLVARNNLPVILMSNQRTKGMGIDRKAKADTAVTDRIMDAVLSFLARSLNIAVGAGIPRENTIIDPGIGFGKDWEQNLEVLRNLSRLKTLGRPILVGTSRKSFIGRILDAPPEARIEGTAATVAISIASGADIVRVHDVKEMALVCRMSDAVVRGYYPGVK